MYFVTLRDGKITGFHYHAEKTELEDNEVEITEQQYNEYINKGLTLFKYKYGNGIKENAQLV